MSFVLKTKEELPTVSYAEGTDVPVQGGRRHFGLCSQSELYLYPVALVIGFVSWECCLTFVCISLLISKIGK